MFRIGVVVEGVYDEAVLRILIGKCRNDARAIIRECRGPIFGKFRGILDDFQSRFKIDKALIVSDANGEQPSTLLTRIRRGLTGRRYGFPVEPLVIVQELEAWLLADEEALQNVVGTKRMLVRSPEDLKDPKRQLLRLLSQRDHIYTPALAGRIADAIRIPILSKRCPSFVKFRNAIVR
jgi:uncharacterized protein DUF4276